MEAGLDLVSPLDQRVVASVRWADVTRIRTYKVDLITTDCICLLFELDNGQAPVRISEEWSGFADLFGPLAAAFPSIPSDWYVDEMTPAFETMHRVLYAAGGTQD